MEKGIEKKMGRVGAKCRILCVPLRDLCRHYNYIYIVTYSKILYLSCLISPLQSPCISFPPSTSLTSPSISSFSLWLLKIPVERIHEVEIPTGLPLVFNVRKKCIQVLEGEDWDDSSLESLDPLSRYLTSSLCYAMLCSAMLCSALLRIVLLYINCFELHSTILDST